jgi:hypothetical protein
MFLCREASEYLLSKLNGDRFKGVCYYDALEGSWVVREARGRCLPRHASPVAESHAFVLYDEARCRGADLQLRPQAVGLLTLGPTTGKDKLMQAAGRLRLLGRGQKLCFAASSDVTAKIELLRDTSPLQPSAVLQAVDILRWVMRNTVEATLHGVVEWAKQGLFFAATFGRPEAVLQDEVLELRKMYASARFAQPVGEVVEGMLQQKHVLSSLSVGGPAAGRSSGLVKAISERSCRHGSGHLVVAGQATDEECERELEKEEEEEEEVERQVERVRPAQEEK